MYSHIASNPSHSRVMSVAGSGKTTCGAHVYNELKSAGSKVLALSFSKDSAAHFTSKITDGRCRTFHSWCLAILLEFDVIDSSFGDIVLPEYQQYVLMSKAASKLKTDYAALKALIVRYINDLDGQNSYDPKVAKAYKQYQLLKQEEGKIDYDDMLSLVYKELLNNEDMRHEIASRYTHIICDEMQDFSRLQIEILRLCCQSNSDIKVTAIGDPYQSIYQWRQAFPTALLGFQSFFGARRDFRLGRSWRCPEAVTRAANTLHDKVDMTSNGSDGELELLYYDSVDNEAQGIATRIDCETSFMNTQPQDIAIVYRYNDQSGPLEEALHGKGLPFKVLGSVKSFFHLPEVRDMVAYLTLSIRDDEDSYRRILNRPVRYLSNKWLQEWRIRGQTLEQMPGNNKGFYQDIQRLRRVEDMTTRMRISHVRSVVGYDKWLKSSTENSIYSDPTNNLNQLECIAQQYPDTSQFLAYVSSMSRVTTRKNSITLSTIHKFKGREARVVFLPGWTAGAFPSPQNSNYGEELNLGYVALTRASQSVFVSCCGRPSKFMEVISS